MSIESGNLICRMLKMVLSSAPDPSQPPDTCPNLSHVLIQPMGPPAPGAPCGNVYLEYAAYKEDLANTMAYMNPVRPITLLPHWVHSEDGWEGVMKHQWLDRLQGGAGCWVESNSSRPAYRNSGREKRRSKRVAQGMLGVLKTVSDPVQRLFANK